MVLLNELTREHQRLALQANSPPFYLAALANTHGQDSSIFENRHQSFLVF
jgi:hypothetical protein